MSESDSKSHWQSLAQAVGAEIRPEPEPSDEAAAGALSKETPPIPPPVRRERPQPAPPPRRTASHWSSLAGELGLEVPEEPEPQEPVAEAISVPGPAAEEYTEEVADFRDPVYDYDQTESARDESETIAIEPDVPPRDTANSIDFGDDAHETTWSDPDLDTTDEAADFEASTEFEQRDTGAVDSRDREDEDETGARRRRKRRGRRRRRRRDDEADSSESREQSDDDTKTIEVVSIGSAELEEIEIVVIEDEDDDEEEPRDEGESDEDKEPRGRRKRRRGRRGSRRRDESPAADDDSESDEASEESSDQDNDNDSDEDEDEADTLERRSKHRKIPTWEQTLAGMIDGNIKNHAATENSGRRGRGRRGR